MGRLQLWCLATLTLVAACGWIESDVATGESTSGNTSPSSGVPQGDSTEEESGQSPQDGHTEPQPEKQQHRQEEDTTRPPPTPEKTRPVDKEEEEQQEEENEEPTTNQATACVSDSRDDAEEWLNDSNDDRPTGYVYTNSGDLELVRDGHYDVEQLVGLRFPDLDVPQGATITDARVIFTAEDDNSGSTDLEISGEADGSASRFEPENDNLSDRARTEAKVEWNDVDSWSTGNEYKSPQLASIIKEITNRSSWESGNALVLLIKGSGARSAMSYDEEPSEAACLRVSFEQP